MAFSPCSSKTGYSPGFGHSPGGPQQIFLSKLQRAIGGQSTSDKHLSSLSSNL